MRRRQWNTMEGELSEGRAKRTGANIFVRAFDKCQSEDDIREASIEHFSSCGDIRRINIPSDNDIDGIKGMAYISFGDINAVNKALELNDSELGDQGLTVRAGQWTVVVMEAITVEEVEDEVEDEAVEEARAEAGVEIMAAVSVQVVVVTEMVDEGLAIVAMTVDVDSVVVK